MSREEAAEGRRIVDAEFLRDTGHCAL